MSDARSATDEDVPLEHEGPTVRVLIADDHPLVRTAVGRLVDRAPNMRTSGMVADYPELWAALGEGTPEVVVLDLNMPGGNGIDAVSRLRRRYPEVAVIVFSATPEQEIVVQLIRAGASGYVEKSSDPERIITAISDVIAGGVHISPEGAAALARPFRSEAGDPEHRGLSNREMQIVRLLGDGLSISEIAEHLHLSPKTVSTYRSRVLKKLDLRSTGDIVRYAVRHGLAQ